MKMKARVSQTTLNLSIGRRHRNLIGGILDHKHFLCSPYCVHCLACSLDDYNIVLGMTASSAFLAPARETYSTVPPEI